MVKCFRELGVLTVVSQVCVACQGSAELQHTRCLAALRKFVLSDQFEIYGAELVLEGKDSTEGCREPWKSVGCKIR